MSQRCARLSAALVGAPPPRSGALSDACLCFAEKGAAVELEQLRAQLATIADEMRPALGPLAAAVLAERDVWLRRKE